MEQDSVVVSTSLPPKADSTISGTNPKTPTISSLTRPSKTADYLATDDSKPDQVEYDRPRLIEGLEGVDSAQST